MSESISDSLRGSLEAAFEQDAGGGVEQATETAAVEQPRGDDGGGASQQRQDGRDASGRFAPKDGGGQQAAAGEPEMPEGYDAGVWAILTPEARRTTAGWAGKQRETVAERDRRLAGFEPLDQVLAGRRETLRGQFGSEAKAVEELFKLSDFAARDFPGFVRFIAQNRGIDLNQALGLAQAAQPEAAAAEQQRQVQGLSPQQVQQLVDQQLENREITRQVSTDYAAFMADGSKEHRNDPAIRKVMQGLMQSETVATFGEAYDIAVHAHPAFGPKLREASAPRPQVQQGSRETAASKAAAASSVTGSPGTHQAPAADDEGDGSIRASILKAYDSAGGRL